MRTIKKHKYKTIRIFSSEYKPIVGTSSLRKCIHCDHIEGEKYYRECNERFDPNFPENEYQIIKKITNVVYFQGTLKECKKIWKEYEIDNTYFKIDEANLKRERKSLLNI